MFGYSREDLVGRPVEVLVPRSFRDRHAAHRRRYAANGKARPMGAGLELYGVRSDGTGFPVEISLSPLETADGRLVSAAVRDVSERKAVEHRIKELALIVESCSDAILTATPEGIVTFWNASAARMYGYSPGAAMGRHLGFLVPPGHGAALEVILKELRGGGAVEHDEALRLTSTGALLDVDVSFWPVFGDRSEVVGICALARDIAERKRAQKELTRLYEEQRHVALTLQRSLMGNPPEVAHLQTAARYLPATQGAGVGGDWFDLVPLGAGRVGIVIGDVMGRGLQAATVMGRLRSAANALACTGMPPSRLINALDQVARDIPDQLVTCCYLVVDPHAGTITAGSAGHLPILEVVPGGQAQRLPIPVSAPLGVGEVPHRQITLCAQPGRTLVLYTDGLIEIDHSDIDEQITRLEQEASAVLGFTYELSEAADQIITGLLPKADQPLDDVTLLLARIPPAPLGGIACTLELRPESVAAARRFVARALAEWDCAELVEDACLLASEMVTNAVRHSRTPVELRMSLTSTEVTVETVDDNCNPPQQREAEETEECGRGLSLVDALAHEWGSCVGATGKTVWFTLLRR
jgi:PAS domain S-box-containing protein